jgi:hypothetical protein
MPARGLDAGRLESKTAFPVLLPEPVRGVQSGFGQKMPFQEGDDRKMRYFWLLFLAWFLVSAPGVPAQEESTDAGGPVMVDEAIEIKGHFLEVMISPEEGGTLTHFNLLSTEGNLAAGNGLLQDGFGVGSHYVPNRRFNEKFEVLRQYADRPVVRYSCDCEGPNIEGLHITKLLEPLPDEASLRVTWTVENRGGETQWIAPWVRNETAPGGSTDAGDRLDLPALCGIVQPAADRYYPASRNWIAATDPAAKETLYTVFHADEIHAFLALWDESRQPKGYQAAFVPKLIKPGETWRTIYRVNAARGLRHVDFATDELACQIDFEAGKLVVLLSAIKPMPDLEIKARVLAPNGRVWRLPGRRFRLDPLHLSRCTWDWAPPSEGAYEFLAQILRFGEVADLGLETGSPHGGIDTRFVVGNGGTGAMAAWTDAPHLLDRGGRVLKRSLASAGDTKIWFEPAASKIFRNDRPEAAGAVNPVHRLAMARNEYESFQVVFHPPEDAELRNVQLHLRDLEHTEGTGRIPAEDIALYNVDYVPVRIPSCYEGPTGEWPDPLPAFAPFSAPGGASTPVWVTVRADADLPAGLYRGLIEVFAAGMEPAELWLEAEVFDFTLPATPHLKTDFGFWLENAAEGAKARGGASSKERLARAWRENALEHRVTLRDLAGFPRESGAYEAALETYQPRMKALLEKGVSTLAVPPALLDTPELLVMANAFALRNRITDRAFTQLADAPPEPAWPRVMETLQRWKDTAPDIPVMITTLGLSPFLPEPADIWCVHSQMMDTPAHTQLLGRVEKDGEVWWYVNHMPPRPYANFFLDFAAMEHRVLFWQAFLAGIRGLHYWGVNYSEPGQDPWQNPCDITPVNGDGRLLYPGADGPVNSIRWECIRDGIEDYDYLALFTALRKKLIQRGGNEALLEKAAKAWDLSAVSPDMVNFTRDPAVLAAKRREIGELISALRNALNE